MLKLNNMQPLNTNTPRETLAYLDGNVVYKIPVSNKDKLILNNWLTKQKLTKQTAEAVYKNNNKTYFIPRVLEISDSDFFVKEERAIGTPLKTSFVETLTEKELDIIYKGLANFTNDINQSKPVLSQKDVFEISGGDDNADNMTINQIIDKLKRYIPENELTVVLQAKTWFDVASEKDASVVFAHGDMNEHNIFFDRKTMRLSIIDFAEAKYQNADYMFNVDYARLGWLDIDRLISEYNRLPKRENVRVKTDMKVKTMRAALYNFKSSAAEFLDKPNIATKVRIDIINQDIKKIKKLYEQINTKNELTNATKTIIAETTKDSTIHKIRNVSNTK